MEIGFLGLGRMGSAMAQNLARGGHQVRAWNRSDKAPPAGVARAGSPAESFDAEVVFSMLADDTAMQQVISAAVLGRARAGAVHVASGTVSLACAEAMVALHREAGIGYVAAPVFGRPQAAETASLAVVAAGAPAAIDRVRPLLGLIGNKLFVIGEEPKQANAAKLAGNMMIAMAIEAMAEAAALAGGSGIAAASFLDLMTETLFGGGVYRTYGAKIGRADPEVGFTMRLGLKDLRLATTAAESAAQSLPQLNAVRTRMAAAVAAGMGDRDWSAIAEFPLRA